MCGGSNTSASSRKGQGAGGAMGGLLGVEGVLGPGGFGYDPTLGEDFGSLKSSLGIAPRPPLDPEHSHTHGNSQVGGGGGAGGGKGGVLWM